MPAALQACNGHRPSPHFNLAGTENDLLASTTNMIRALRSVVPALKTCIGMPAGCPFIVWPAST